MSNIGTVTVSIVQSSENHPDVRPEEWGVETSTNWTVCFDRALKKKSVIISPSLGPAHVQVAASDLER